MRPLSKKGVSEKIDQFIAGNGGNTRDALNVALARIDLMQAKIDHYALQVFYELDDEMIESQQAELKKTRAMLSECLDVLREIQRVDILEKLENGYFILPLEVRKKMVDIFQQV